MTENTEYKRPTVLEEMDSYNTAPIEESGSIMEGILREQTGLAEPTQTPTTEPTEPTTKKELPSDYITLNSSIQELNKNISEKFNHYDRRFNELSNNFDAVRQPVQQQQTQQQHYDPEAPATMAHLSQVYQAYTNINQRADEAFRNSALTRGQIEYMRYKQENPSFDMDPREIDNVVNMAFKTGKTEMLKDANWRSHFDALYRPTLDGKLSESGNT